MPGPYVEQAEDQFNYVEDWKEVAEDSERGSAHFADTAQEDTLFGWIPWNKRRSALRFFKGFAYADTAAPWRLHREQPHQHPDYPWLRAYDVSFGGAVLEANTDNPNNSPYDMTPFVLDPVTRRTKYLKCLCAVKYRAFGDVWFLEDDEIESPKDEWFRNTLLLPPEPQVEALTVTGGLSQLRFSETSSTGPKITGDGTRFTAPLAELQCKTTLRLLWWHVEWDYLSSSNNFFRPTKIEACIGRVNSDTLFDEFEPETLLMLPPQYEIFPWWVASDDTTEPLMGVNVTLNFSFFDPPLGATNPHRHGWNNMPWGGNGIVNGDGKYYRATRNGSNSGRGLLEAVPMMDIFTHVSS
jgi:hypothetical protein